MAKGKKELEGILIAITYLAESLDLVGAVTYGRRGSKIAAIEACAHEISHRIFTGPTFESALLNMAPRAANRHEASALRVEIAVLHRLGCKVSLRTLWARANWQCCSVNKRPAWAAMTLPLTVREERCSLTMTRQLQRVLAGLNDKFQSVLVSRKLV